MQTTSSGWNHIVQKSHRRFDIGALISWTRTTGSGVKFFTINQSTIGGTDIIKSGGGFVTLFDKYNYLNYSDKVNAFSTKRGLGQYPFGVINAEADLELDNTNREFLPSSTTVGSGILPNRPLKLSIGLDDEYMKIFVGFSLQPENTLNNRITKLHAFDVYSFAAGFVSTASGAQTNKYANEIIEDLLQEQGFSSNQYVLDSSLQQPIGYLATNGRLAGDIFRDLAEAEQALIFTDENGIFRFWNRQHFTTTSGVEAFNLSYSTLSDLQWQNTAVINDVIVKAKPRAVAGTARVYTLEQTITLDSTSKDVFIDFEDDNGVLPVTDITPPTADGETSYFVANASEDGTGVDRTDRVTVTSAYLFGNTVRLTFARTGTVSVYITKLDLYGTPAKVKEIIEERYQDDESIETFGRNPANNGEPIIIENDLIQENDTAYSLAYTLVNEYKDPRKRYVAPVAVNTNPALQVGDYGTLTIQDTGQTISCWIVDIENAVGRNGEYKQQLILEERNIKQYFTIGVSTIGGAHSIAP